MLNLLWAPPFVVPKPFKTISWDFFLLHRLISAIQDRLLKSYVCLFLDRSLQLTLPLSRSFLLNWQRLTHRAAVVVYVRLFWSTLGADWLPHPRNIIIDSKRAQRLVDIQGLVLLLLVVWWSTALYLLIKGTVTVSKFKHRTWLAHDGKATHFGELRHTDLRICVFLR